MHGEARVIWKMKTANCKVMAVFGRRRHLHLADNLCGYSTRTGPFLHNKCRYVRPGEYACRTV